MGLFAKEKLRIEDIAPELANIVLRSIAPSKIEKLREFGINPDSPSHKLEIVIFSLFSLRAAIPSALDQDKGTTLLLYIEQLLKISYVDVLKLSTTNQFEIVLQTRYDEYEANLATIGLRFVKNIEIEDIALVYWANRTFGEIRLMYIEFLKEIDKRYQLI